MAKRVLGWFGLITVILISLFGFPFYITFLTLLLSFLTGVLTILYFNYDQSKIFSVDFDCPDDPLQQTNISVQLTKVLHLFQKETSLPKFDNRITGSETVDTFLNEIILIIINDYVNPWYEILTNDEELPSHSIKRVVVTTGANVANRVKCVDWIHLLSTKFPEELTTHLKLFKQSKVRLKRVNLLNAKDETNGNPKPSPKKLDEKKTHRRNKSETDLSWPLDSQIYGKSKFYDSSENLSGNTLTDIFFDLECSIENRQICRDTFCIDSDKEYALLCEVSEVVLYLVAPEEVWKCHALKLILIELLSAVVLRPLIALMSDPDNINRAIVRTFLGEISLGTHLSPHIPAFYISMVRRARALLRIGAAVFHLDIMLRQCPFQHHTTAHYICILCCRDSCLPSELFLLVIRCCGDAEELDATLELVERDIQKLHSRDSAGEWELQDRQKLSSLQYLTRIIQARKATLGPQEGASTSSSTEKIPEEVTRSLKFLRDITAWRSNAQYLLEIELNDSESPHTSKAVVESLRSSALELCDRYLAAARGRPAVLGAPAHAYADLVRKINTDGEHFTDNPLLCFDDLQKCVCDALEDDPTWQSDFMMDGEQDGSDRNTCDLKKEDKMDTKKYSEKCKKLMKTCLNQLPKLFKKSKYKNDVPMKAFTFPRSFTRRVPSTKNHTLPKCGDSLPVPGARHSRSRSDIVGNFAQQIINESAGPSSLSSVTTSNLSLSHSSISQNAKNMLSPLTASIIETALVQEKGKAFGIYAIAVTRQADGEVWHIYRRYSDFYDLHASVKEKWPELGSIPFPAKRTFQNTSRGVLESRKTMLDAYLQRLTGLARDARYAALLSRDYLGGFLSPETQAERHTNTIDALLVNSLRAGMRTLKNMPDQFANTVDGVMDGISKVFQGKSGENYYDGFKSGSSSEAQDDGDESAALRLLEEVLGIRGLWLRRRLLAPLRTLISDRVNKKVYDLVSSLTSPRNVVQYLKMFKQWLTARNSPSHANRDAATKARTRVAAKVALLSACSDDLRHIVGSDTARRGLLSVFDLFQTQEINRRLVFVLLEAILTNLFPDNNIPELFKKLYSNSPRVPTPKKTINV